VRRCPSGQPCSDRRRDTHRYSVSRGIPRLRRAICAWYGRRYGVELDPERESIVTIGSKEGLAHLALATVGPGDAVLVPNPSYPIHPFALIENEHRIRQAVRGVRGMFRRERGRPGQAEGAA